ncbi:MAG: hypothetical protein VKI42_03535 [Synechococcaceae cyanobacterium]|nr:hypothetical protein [Synechococcaceae cyanobacterium]
MRLTATDPRQGGRPLTPHRPAGNRGDRCGGAVARVLLAATGLVALTALKGAAAPLVVLARQGAATPQGSAAPERSAPPRVAAPLPLAAPTPAGPLLAAAPVKPAKGRAAPSAASQVALRKQALQALEQGDLRRGCPLLRRAIDQTGALYARNPSPALETELRGLLGRLQPCLRKGF